MHEDQFFSIKRQAVEACLVEMATKVSPHQNSVDTIQKSFVLLQLSGGPHEAGFDLSPKTDPWSKYEPLRDPSLLQHLTKASNLRRLIRLGLVTKEGKVVTPQRMLMEYRNNFLQKLQILRQKNLVRKLAEDLGATSTLDGF